MQKNWLLIHSSHYMQWCTAGFWLIAFTVQIYRVGIVLNIHYKKLDRFVVGFIEIFRWIISGDNP